MSRFGKIAASQLTPTGPCLSRPLADGVPTVATTPQFIGYCLQARFILAGGQANLAHVVRACRPPPRLAGRIDGRQQQADQDADDRDHHQQLDERKTLHVRRFGLLPEQPGAASNCHHSWMNI